MSFTFGNSGSTFGQTGTFGSFGQNANNNTNKPLFGTTTPAVTTTSTSATPSLFGNTTTNNAFGTSTNSNPTNTSTSLFGSTAATPFGGTSNTGTTSGFGTSMFNTATTSAAQPSFSFGNNATSTTFGNNATSTTFGNNATSTPFGNNATFGAIATNVQPMQTNIDPNNPLVQLNQLYQHYSGKSPNCSFQHVFYNFVHPSDVPLYTKPPSMSDRLWQQALADNPDSTCMVPVLAVGFSDLKKRVDKQNQNNEDIKVKLQVMVDLFYNSRN
jgi:nuclear pore complex protein Nup54